MHQNSIIGTFISVMLFSPWTLAATISSEPSSYFVVDQKTKEFLKDLARDSGVRISVSDAVRGQITRKSLNGSTQEIVSKVATQQDLDWFEYNKVIFISAKSETRIRIIRLGDLTYDDAIKALTQSNLVSARFPMSPTAEKSALSVSAPPKLLAIVESIIEGIPSKPTKNRATVQNTIRLRRGTDVEEVQVR